MPANFSPMNYPGMRGGALSSRAATRVTPVKEPQQPDLNSNLPPQPMWQPSFNAPSAEPMRSPMAPAASPMNRPQTGLAGAGTRQVGRSNYDLNRISERMYRQTKNPSMLLQMDWRNRMGSGASSAQPSPMMLPSDSTKPSGKLVPGISQGSMVWQPDAAPEVPALPDSPAPDAAISTPKPPPASPMATGQPFVPPALPAPMRPTDARGLRPLPWEPQQTLDITKPLPPSTLGGGTGVPPPPLVSSVPIPGTDHVMPMFGGVPSKQTLPKSQPAKPVLTNEQQARIRAAGMEHTGEFDAQGIPVLKPIEEKNSPWQLTDIPGPMVEDPVTKKQVPGPARKVQVNRITGEYRELTPQGGQANATAPQQPSWMDWLKSKTAK